mgnify:CR=1 FL=1
MAEMQPRQRLDLQRQHGLPLRLGEMAPGEFRPLRPMELDRLREIARSLELDLDHPKFGHGKLVEELFEHPSVNSLASAPSGPTGRAISHGARADGPW